MEKLWHLFIVVGLISSFGCSPVAQKGETSSIIGKDDRTPASRSSLAITKAIGQLINSTQDRICTATVFTTDQIITAAHCISSKSDQLKFVKVDGTSLDISAVVSLDRGTDIARIKLAQPQKYFIPLATESSSNASLVTFDSKSPSALMGRCSMAADQSLAGILLHDCDTQEGSSGAALIYQNKIVGIHIGSVASLHRNAAVDLTQPNQRISKSLSQLISQDLVVEACSWRNPGDCIKNPGATIGGAVEAALDEAKRAVSNLGIGDWQSGVIEAIAKPTSRAVEGESERGGWTEERCLGIGAGTIYAASLPFQSTICGAIGAGVGTGICLGYLSSSSGLLAAATCTQLCNDHHLRDEKCK